MITRQLRGQRPGHDVGHPEHERSASEQRARPRTPRTRPRTTVGASARASRSGCRQRPPQHPATERCSSSHGSHEQRASRHRDQGGASRRTGRQRREDDHVVQGDADQRTRLADQSTAQAVDAAAAARNEATRMRVISPVCGMGHMLDHDRRAYEQEQRERRPGSRRGPAAGVPRVVRSASASASPSPIVAWPDADRATPRATSASCAMLAHCHAHEVGSMALARTNVTIPAELLRAGGQVRWTRAAGARSWRTPSRRASSGNACDGHWMPTEGRLCRHAVRMHADAAYRWVRDQREDPDEQPRPVSYLLDSTAHHRLHHSATRREWQPSGTTVRPSIGAVYLRGRHVRDPVRRHSRGPRGGACRLLERAGVRRGRSGGGTLGRRATGGAVAGASRRHLGDALIAGPRLATGRHHRHPQPTRLRGIRRAGPGLRDRLSRADRGRYRLRYDMRDVLDRLEALGLRWYITGSEAGACYGVLRQTFDTDIVLDLTPGQFPTIAGAFEAGSRVADEIDYGDLLDGVGHRSTEHRRRPT